MKICLLTFEGVEYLDTVFDLPTLSSFNQFLDFLENCWPEIYEKVRESRFKIGLLKSLDSEPVLWQPGLNTASFAEYEYLFLIEDVDGEFAVTATMVLSASIALTGTLVVGYTAAAIIAFVINMVIMMAVSFVIGKILEALSPSQNSGNSESANAYKKSLLFVDNAQITTQGTPVPWILGECTCFGVIIGRVIGTYEWESGTDLYTPNLPAGIPSIAKASLSGAVESSWYRLTI